VIRLVVVDDHPPIAAAVVAAAASSGDLAVVGTAGDAATGVELIDSLLPDVVVCDVWLSGWPDGLRIAEQFGGRPRPRVLMYTGFEHRSFLRAAFEAGVAGYVSKAAPLDELIEAVRAVAGGDTVFPAVTLMALREAPRRPSERELETICLLAGGATNDEIAMRLGISIKTVESHLRRLFGRYGVLSRTELAILAVREGWLGAQP
jgi:DNA-binding NarL/FixJ family response regulator